MPFKDIRKKLEQYVALGKLLRDDARVPLVSKILLAIAIGYFFLPFDLIPDFIPVLGQLDDILIIPSLVALAFYLIPKNILREHQERVLREATKDKH